MINDLLDKITSYNLFNYLLPGVLFAVLATSLTDVTLVQEDVVTGAFFYYFLGVVISRIGSLILESLLEWIGFLTTGDYGEYVSASKADQKIEVLLETRNMYRSLLAVFISLLGLKTYLWIEGSFPGLEALRAWLAIGFFIALFLFSYRKQTKYIISRAQERTNE